MKIIRNRGSWHGKLAGFDQQLPIGHSTNIDWASKRYVEVAREPAGQPVRERWRHWIDDVMRTKCMIIQVTRLDHDNLDDDGYPKVHADGYVGVFFVDNVKFEDNVFSCDLTGRRA
jgi:hypothetical protein